MLIEGSIIIKVCVYLITRELCNNCQINELLTKSGYMTRPEPQGLDFLSNCDINLRQFIANQVQRTEHQLHKLTSCT